MCSWRVNAEKSLHVGPLGLVALRLSRWLRHYVCTVAGTFVNAQYIFWASEAPGRIELPSSIAVSQLEI